MSADKRPPKPQNLSLAVHPNKFGKTYDPWPAGIMSPNTFNKLSPKVTLFC